MCGSKCTRCGEYMGEYGHPRGCALPVSTRQAIMYSGLPVRAGEAAIAAAEDEALREWGQDYLRERRNADVIERAQNPTTMQPGPVLWWPVASGVPFTVTA